MELTNRARTEILRRIDDGAFAPGDWIRESTLAQQIGLSRTPVREALRSLAAEGYIEIHENRGARVAPISTASLQQHYQVRTMLEGRAACLAAQTAPGLLIRELEAAADAFYLAITERDGEHVADLIVADNSFHALVIHAAQSKPLEAALSTIAPVQKSRMAFRAFRYEDLSRCDAQHREIIWAIESGDGDLAEAAMTHHLLAELQAAARGIAHAGHAASERAVQR